MDKDYHYNQTVEHWAAFQAYWLGFDKTSPNRRNLIVRRVVRLVLVAALAVELLFGCWLQFRYGTFFQDHPLLQIGIILLLIFCINSLKLLFSADEVRKLYVKTAARKPKYVSDFVGECTAWFEGDLYCERLSTGSEKKVPCASVFRAPEAFGCIFLFYQEHTAFVVPLETFSCAEEKQEFLSHFPSLSVTE